MPAKSKAQQEFMAIAEHEPGKLHGKKPNMSHEQLHDFAATPTKGLPEKIGNDGSGIHIKESHKGLLHKDLGVPQGQKIPASKIESATHSSNPVLKKRAVFAENAKKWHDGKECGTCDRIFGEEE